MFKVLIVDDEPNIRRGLIKIIDWNAYQCEIIGEAVDGMEGLEMIREHLPDLIIADINMPEMNGLEMIAKAKEAVPQSKFIILTGYRDFAYLQEAIRIGAFDYILKPSKIEHIVSVIKKATLELKYQQASVIEAEKLKENFQKSIPLLKEKLLEDYLLRRRRYKESDEELLTLYQIEVQDFILISFTLDEADAKIGIEEQHLYQYEILNALNEIFGCDYRNESVCLGPSQVMVISQCSKQEGFESVGQKIQDVHQLLKNCFAYGVSISISSKGQGVRSLGDKMEECEACLSHQFYLGKDTVIFYSDLEGFYTGKGELKIEGMDRELLLSVKAGDTRKMEDKLEEIKASIALAGPSLSIEAVKMFYSNLIYQINQIRLSFKELENQEEVPINLYSFYQMVDVCSDINELHDILEEASKSLVQKIENYNQSSIHTTMQLSLDYIHQNYHIPMTLDDLAKHAYVSTFYLSRLFKKELGKNFIDYLNELRINKAKELLIESDLKTYEIAEKVGITDPHYFSRLFKKHTGISPTEYRNE